MSIFSKSKSPSKIVERRVVVNLADGDFINLTLSNDMDQMRKLFPAMNNGWYLYDALKKADFSEALAWLLQAEQVCVAEDEYFNMSHAVRVKLMA